MCKIAYEFTAGKNRIFASHKNEAVQIKSGTLMIVSASLYRGACGGEVMKRPEITIQIPSSKFIIRYVKINADYRFLKSIFNLKVN